MLSMSPKQGFTPFIINFIIIIMIIVIIIIIIIIMMFTVTREDCHGNHER